MMSTHFGGGAGGDADERKGDGWSAPQADELRGLIERIADQLNHSEQRQAAALAQMLARVEALGAEASDYKAKLPQEFLPAFERIEDGVSQLADRIARSHGARNNQSQDTGMWGSHDTHHNEAVAGNAPIAADIAQVSGHAPETQPSSPQNSTQSVAPAHAIDPVVANDETAWDQQSADALVAHYENELGAAAADANYGLSDNLDDILMEPLRVIGAVQPRVNGEAQRDVRASLLDSERNWLEEHFVDVARKVEESLSQRSPVDALTGLGERFDQLEKRFGSTMHDVATRSDVEALHVLEAHIADLAQQFDDTRSQLSRLDSIEHSLAAVIDRLTDPRFESALERTGADHQDLEPMISAAVEQIAQHLHSSQPAMPDFKGLAQGIAEATAERVATRIGGIAPARSGSSEADIDSIRQLLDGFINERRQGEEHTAVMLDTMQQALIRVLDRVDALESTSSKVAADYGRFQAEPVAARPHEATSAGLASAAGAAFARGGSYGAQDQDDFADDYNEPAVAVATGHQPPRLPNSPASIERLRKDFIADARRAKDKATGVAPEAPPADLRATPPRVLTGQPDPNSVKLGKPGKEPAGEADKGRTGVVSRLRMPSRKLLVGAIVLMIAIPGVLMLLKKGQATAPAPTSIERSQAPNDRAVAPVSPTKQTDEGASVNPNATTDVPKNEAPSAAPEAVAPIGSSSMPPKLPRAGHDATGSGLSPVAPPSDRNNTAPRSENTAPIGGDASIQELPKTQSLGPAHESVPPASAALKSGSTARAAADGGPPAGITVAMPRKTPSLAQLERLNERNATAQLSNQLGNAQVNAVPTALIPEFMQGETQSGTSPITPKIQASTSDSRRQPLDLPPAQVGPISLRMAAANGNPSAEFAVAARFADGTGVSQNLDEAMRWYQRSASRGFAQSQYRVATFYERGLGVKSDIARAKIWYQRAAESGNIKAMHNLAVLSAGRTAKLPDYKTAAQWFKSASEYGLADSQFNLAVLHESGLGVAQSVEDAYFWFALAARNGDTEAVRRQNELQQRLNPTQLEEAKRKLDNWRPKQADRVANDPLAASEAWKSQAAAEGAI